MSTSFSIAGSTHSASIASNVKTLSRVTHQSRLTSTQCRRAARAGVSLQRDVVLLQLKVDLFDRQVARGDGVALATILAELSDPKTEAACQRRAVHQVVEGLGRECDAALIRGAGLCS